MRGSTISKSRAWEVPCDRSALTELCGARRFPDYVPPSVPWEMTEVINNLITYSLYLLKPGGRLVFFLPTDNVSRCPLGPGRVRRWRLRASQGR